MKKVELQIVPFAGKNAAKTRLVVNGSKIDSKDNRLTNLVVFQPMRKWLNPYRKKLFVWGGLMKEIIEELNDNEIHFVFKGCLADYTLFKRGMIAQQMKLNRNAGAVRVTFEHVDSFSPQKYLKEITHMLEDMRVEADNWGEDEIISKIDGEIQRIKRVSVGVLTDYHSSGSKIVSFLEQEKILPSKDSHLQVIFIDDALSSSDVKGLTALLEKTADDQEMLLINTSDKKYAPVLDAIFSPDGQRNAGIKYIQISAQESAKEIEKLYWLSTLPEVLSKAAEILRLFPDCETNSYLIDIQDRLNDMFSHLTE